MSKRLLSRLAYEPCKPVGMRQRFERCPVQAEGVVVVVVILVGAATCAIGATGGIASCLLGRRRLPLKRNVKMLSWALVFLVVALIAGVLGFTSIAGAAVGIAKILFFVFLVLFAVSAIMHMVRGRRV